MVRMVLTGMIVVYKLLEVDETVSERALYEDGKGDDSRTTPDDKLPEGVGF